MSTKKIKKKTNETQYNLSKSGKKLVLKNITFDKLIGEFSVDNPHIKNQLSLF